MMRRTPARRSGIHGDVWRLAGPIIISNLSVPLLGAVDTAVVGHLPGPQYLGAVAIGALIFSFLYWGFGFLRMGTTGLTAQAVGARDEQEVRAVLYRALLVGVVLSSVILILQRPVGWLAFALIDASRQVEVLASDYFAIRVWGAPAALANYAVLGWFLGRQNARIPLLLQVVTNGVNIVLDLWFVLGLGWGVSGVAAATVIAEFAGLALGVLFIHRHLRGRLTGNVDLSRILDPAAVARTVAVNRDIFLRTLCLIFAFAYWTAESAKLGDVTLAANTVLLNFLTFAAYALDGFAHAAEALIGKACGASDRSAFSRAVRTSMLWAALFAVSFTAFYAVAGQHIVALLTDLPEVRAVALTYLPWAVVLPIVSVWAFAYDGIFIGATRTRALRNGMGLALLLYLVTLWVSRDLWENHGMWLALLGFMIYRAVALAVQYPALVRDMAESGGALRHVASD